MPFGWERYESYHHSIKDQEREAEEKRKEWEWEDEYYYGIKKEDEDGRK